MSNNPSHHTESPSQLTPPSRQAPPSQLNQLRLQAPPRIDPARRPHETIDLSSGPKKPVGGWTMWLTGLFFGLLGLAAIGVFVVLPDWVQNRQSAAELTEPEPAAAAIEAVSAEAAPTETLSPAAPPPTVPAPAGLLDDRPDPAQADDTSVVATTSPKSSAQPRRSAPRPAKRTSNTTIDPEFQAAMTQGLAALDQKDYAAARDAFSRAAALRPSASQSADGLARATQGLRLENIKTLRQQASDREAQEDWHAAAEQYRAVLAIDPTVQFAQDGHDRSRRRAELSDRLQNHITQPARLSSEAVLAEAKTLLDEARETEPSGAKLQRQFSQLGRLVESFSTPVQATFESDNLTEVVVYKVGRLGAFDRRTLDLRPGTYTVVGSRRGYRDVRQRLEIAPGVQPQPVAIRCEEKI